MDFSSYMFNLILQSALKNGISSLNYIILAIQQDIATEEQNGINYASRKETLHRRDDRSHR